MIDIGLFWGIGQADFALVNGDLASDDGLETAVTLSLFTDRRAEPGDEVPPEETDRRGWWGDALADVTGDKFGSRLWLLAREKQLATSLPRAREYALQSLQWLLDDKIAEAVEVVTEISAPGMLGIGVSIKRPMTDPVDFRFNYAWAAQEARH